MEPRTSFTGMATSDPSDKIGRDAELDFLNTLQFNLTGIGTTNRGCARQRFGVRQSSAALDASGDAESARGLEQSKTWRSFPASLSKIRPVDERFMESLHSLCARIGTMNPPARPRRKVSESRTRTRPRTKVRSVEFRFMDGIAVRNPCRLPTDLAGS